MVNQFYDIPRPLKRKCQSGSAELRAFYNLFFVNWLGVVRGEVNLDFLNQLSPNELAIARELVRRNLGKGSLHLVKGAAALKDVDALPILRTLFNNHTDLSRRLTIAGSLWKLDRDPRFLECIEQMIASDSNTLKEVHIDKVLWIGDERSINYLILLLDDGGKFVRSLALRFLNLIERGRRSSSADPQTSASDYKMLQSDPDFIGRMVTRLQQWNLQEGGN